MKDKETNYYLFKRDFFVKDVGLFSNSTKEINKSL